MDRPRRPRTPRTDEAKALHAEPDIPSRSLPDSPSKDSIALRAYRRFEERGRQHGHDLEDWLEAEREFTRVVPE